jgi:hypothetical protein
MINMDAIVTVLKDLFDRVSTDVNSRHKSIIIFNIIDIEQAKTGVIAYAKTFTEYPVRISRIEILKYMDIINWKVLKDGKIKVKSIIKGDK